MKNQNFMRDIEDYLASKRIPDGCEECIIVKTQEFYVWMRPDEVRPDEQVCFYDGDYREVLTRSDPKLRDRFH
jgi:hypothetical protein